jgi:hypothetical protein
VREGDVSVAAAAERYGVVFREAGGAWTIDRAATEELRAQKKALAPSSS